MRWKKRFVAEIGKISIMAWSLTLISFPALAWNAQDHKAMGRMALEGVAPRWGLLEPVLIHPIDSLLEKLGKIDETLGDFWHLSDFIKINPAVPWDHPLPEEEKRGTITPLEILSLHSVDPDDGRDKNLFIRDAQGNPHYAFRDQFWFGSLQGGNSQAFRHLEKPPFSWSHWRSTFGFPFRAVGEGTTRAEIYYQLALLCFNLHEDYWGWRFLAGSFHYLQDLENPYHAAQITPELLIKGLKAYGAWGRSEKKGLMSTLAHVVSNSHRFMETYLEKSPFLLRGRSYSPPETPIGQPLTGSLAPFGRPEQVRSGQYSRAIESDLSSYKSPNYEPLKGDDVLSVASIHDLALQVRDESNRFFPESSHNVGLITTPALEGSHLFNSDTLPYDDPFPYLDKESPDFAPANARIHEIVADRFAATGRVLRTEVKLLLQEKTAITDPKKILQEISRLVNLHPQREP